MPATDLSVIVTNIITIPSKYYITEACTMLQGFQKFIFINYFSP